MNFDTAIHLGDLLLALGLLGGGFAIWGRFTVIETKVAILWVWWQGQHVEKK